MVNDVVQFPIRDEFKGRIRKIIIDFGSAASQALDARIAAENVNASTIVGRSVQLYDVFQTMTDQLSQFDRVSGVVIGPGGVRLHVTVESPK
jgi:hypothetical protein